MKCNAQKIQKLAMVEMYAGDTTPWHVEVYQEDGTRFTLVQLSECTARFSIQKVCDVLAEMDGEINVDPVFVKDCNLLCDISGFANVIIDLAEEDTINLYGDYVYQIEIRQAEDVRLGQGLLKIFKKI